VCQGEGCGECVRATRRQARQDGLSHCHVRRVFFLDGPNKYAARTCHRHVVHDAVIALRRWRYHRVGVRHREL
jgi:hypothetical protein